MQARPDGARASHDVTVRVLCFAARSAQDEAALARLDNATLQVVQRVRQTTVVIVSAPSPFFEA